jgi:hypothetical protein
MEVQVDGIRGCFHDLNRKYKVPRRLLEPFEASVTKKLRRCVEIQKKWTLEIVEPIDRELAERVLLLEKHVEGCRRELSGKRKALCDSTAENLQLKWDFEDNFDMKLPNDNMKSLKSSKLEITEESVNKLQSLLTDYTKLVKELGVAVPSCISKLESTISLCASGAAWKETSLDVAMKNASEEREQQILNAGNEILKQGNDKAALDEDRASSISNGRLLAQMITHTMSSRLSTSSVQAKNEAAEDIKTVLYATVNEGGENERRNTGSNLSGVSKKLQGRNVNCAPVFEEENKDFLTIGKPNSKNKVFDGIPKKQTTKESTAKPRAVLKDQGNCMSLTSNRTCA